MLLVSADRLILYDGFFSYRTTVDEFEGSTIERSAIIRTAMLLSTDEERTILLYGLVIRVNGTSLGGRRPIHWGQG